MKAIPSYYEFIVEKLGVPEDIKPMAKALTDLVMGAARKQFPSLVMSSGPIEPFHEGVKVPKTERFPLDAVELISYCSIIPEDVSTGMKDEVPFVEGEFAGLFDGELGLMARMKLKPTAKIAFLKKPNWEKLLRPHVEAAAMHELTHAFESYQRRAHHAHNFALSSRGVFDAAGSNYGTVEHVPQALNDFLFVMYLCASYEVNARAAQAEPYVRGKRSNETKLAALKATPMWLDAMKMSSFSADQTMKALVAEYGSEQAVDLEIEKFKGWMLAVADKTMKMFFLSPDEPLGLEERDRMIQFFKSHDGQNILSMAHRSTRQMLSYWEKKAHIQGEDLRRRLLRTIAI